MYKPLILLNRLAQSIDSTGVEISVLPSAALLLPISIIAVRKGNYATRKFAVGAGICDLGA
jgi:hypothetical protein